MPRHAPQKGRGSSSGSSSSEAPTVVVSSPSRRRGRSSGSSPGHKRRRSEDSRKAREAESDDGKDKHRKRSRAKDREKDGGKNRGKSKDGGKQRGHEKEKGRARDDKNSKKDKPRDNGSKADGVSTEKPSRKGRSLDGKADGGNALTKAEPAGGTPDGLAGLGDLAALQRRLSEDRESLQLFVLKAKQEFENKPQDKDKANKQRRDKEYFRAEVGEPCGPDNRLIIEEALGHGAFSTVFRCTDLKANCKEYAVKFIRSNAMLRKASEKEVRLMRKLRSLGSEKDPEGARYLLGLIGPEVFEHQGHLAMVFQLQKCSARAGLARYGQGHGLPLPLVRTYARNIFLALRALCKINVIHGDLKPDNLLISLDKASLKLSDFGSAMETSERVRTDFLQPMFYRAPEVILGHTYTTQIDIWSAGCTIFELITGKFLYIGKNNNGMVHEMLKGCGPFTKKFATTGAFSARHFNAGGDFRLKSESPDKAEEAKPMALFPKHSPQAAPFLKRLRDETKEPIDSVEARAHQKALSKLAELIAKCMMPDPSERITSEPALAHSSLKEPSSAGAK